MRPIHKLLIEHVAAYTAGMVTTIGILWGVAKPHIDNYIDARIYAPIPTAYIQKLDAKTYDRITWLFTGKMLAIFLNIPEAERTEYQKAQIILLSSEFDRLGALVDTEADASP